MSELARSVGQLLWCGFQGTSVPGPFLRRVTAGEVGAAVLFRRNIGEVEDILALNATLHSAAPADAPLLVAVDQEGGRVQRVRAPATEWPPMLRLGERLAAGGDAVELAAQVGRALGAELAVLGFDLDFAPVLDVHTNPQNPIIGDRAFATTPEAVSALAGAFARGLSLAGVLPCGKHFPGHGDTTEDSHLALPRIDHDLDRLNAVELAPFRANVELPVIMTAHVVFAALDPEIPATLSPAVLQGLLRGQLGYRGLILSDDLEMKAILDHYGAGEAAVRALLAGCDAFLVCAREDLQIEVHEALVRAAESSAATRARVVEAAARVAALKTRHTFQEPETAGRAREILGAPAHQALVRQIAAEIGR